jgi:hypothetical protein
LGIQEGSQVEVNSVLNGMSQEMTNSSTTALFLKLSCGVMCQEAFKATEQI